MYKPQIMGVFSAIFGLIIVSTVFNSGNNTPMSQWPMEGFQNLAFSIGWLSPFPNAMVYIIAVLILLLVATIFYKFGVWLFRQATGN
ncbi:hypothetical protein [Psychrobacter sp.]|uniref:hypothetical protein n=1 Tax=Psychrobacter sp. TaxID=56811 RepID=UPI0025EB4EDB|nr:hypothetical protein [Psychrobacter sp.]